MRVVPSTIFPPKSRKGMAILAFIPTFVLFAVFGDKLAFGQDRGLQFVGLSKANPTDIQFLTSQINETSSSVQVSLLPFEFSPDLTFANLTNLTAMTNRSFRVAICLAWFPHDPVGNGQQSTFWNAWQASNPTASQLNIRNAFLQRVNATCRFINTTRAIHGSRIRFTIIPVLEDTCTLSQRRGFENLIATIVSTQNAMNAPAQLRRSCLLNNIFRINGLSLELHGKWADCSRFLVSGDTWSNDGTAYSWNEFVVDQSKARHLGVNTLWWHELYNGTPRLRDNWASRTVNPFSGPSAQQQRSALREVLRR